jgi:AcrR family transcriptional regulator
MTESHAAASPLFNEPKQARSRQTVNTILEAAAELFVTDIALRAGKPVGSVYTYFKDKQQILLALWDRLYREEAEAALDELALTHGTDLREVISRAVARLFERRALYRKLSPTIAYLTTQNPDVAARVRELNHLALQRLQQFLHRVNELGLGRIADPEAAALVIQVTTETLAGMGLPYTTHVERQRVQASLTEMLYSYITSPRSDLPSQV